jgi:hypothetical protein
MLLERITREEERKWTVLRAPRWACRATGRRALHMRVEDSWCCYVDHGVGTHILVYIDDYLVCSVNDPA